MAKYTVYGSFISFGIGEPRSVLIGDFDQKTAAIKFAREAVNWHNIGHTCVVGPITTVKEFYRHFITDEERAGLDARDPQHDYPIVPVRP